MAKIHKLKKDKKTVYPLTIKQAVYDPDTKESLDVELKQIVQSIIIGGVGWYGIEWDENVANSACTRIGTMDLHRTLPIQNRQRRCLLNDDGTVRHYLNANDSTLLDNGAPAKLDGSMGQVMVEMPSHWRRFERVGTKWRAMISEFKFPGFHYVPKAYRSAYEATVERSTNKLCSVMNMGADYRGGNNNADWDGTYRTLLGRPASSISGTNFASYANNRGARWTMDAYHVKKSMDWLYYIEYANFNSQLAYNPVLTAEGYKQGGLGDGVTTLSSTKWNDFNGRYGFSECGFSNELGNYTGVVELSMPIEYDESVLTVEQPSYRGVEHPFGHTWKWTDGVKVNIQADDAGGQSQLYVCEDPLKFQHSNYDGYDMRGLLPRANGYVSKMLMGEYGEVMPRVADGGSTTYFADYFYTSIPSSGESQRGVLFGGYSSYGAYAGLASAHANNTFAASHPTIGSRLCFIPE